MERGDRYEFTGLRPNVFGAVNSSVSVPYSRPVTAESLEEQALQQIPQIVMAELSPFVILEESRALMLFHDPEMAVADIMSLCQEYGSMYYIRPDFSSNGVTFVGYFDLRCAIKAYAEIQSHPNFNITVKYTLMLYSSGGDVHEDSIVIGNSKPVVCKCSEISAKYIDEETVAPVLSDEEDDRITKTLQHDFDWLEHMIGESYEQALSGSPVPSDEVDAAAKIRYIYSSSVHSGGSSSKAGLISRCMHLVQNPLSSESCTLEFYNIHDARRLFRILQLCPRTQLEAASVQYHRSVQYLALDPEVKALRKSFIKLVKRWSSHSLNHTTPQTEEEEADTSEPDAPMSRSYEDSSAANIIPMEPIVDVEDSSAMGHESVKPTARTIAPVYTPASIPVDLAPSTSPTTASIGLPPGLTVDDVDKDVGREHEGLGGANSKIRGMRNEVTEAVKADHWNAKNAPIRTMQPPPSQFVPSTAPLLQDQSDSKTAVRRVSIASSTGDSSIHSIHSSHSLRDSSHSLSDSYREGANEIIRNDMRSDRDVVKEDERYVHQPLTVDHQPVYHHQQQQPSRQNIAEPNNNEYRNGPHDPQNRYDQTGQVWPSLGQSLYPPQDQLHYPSQSPVNLNAHPRASNRQDGSGGIREAVRGYVDKHHTHTATPSYHSNYLNNNQNNNQQYGRKSMHSPTMSVYEVQEQQLHQHYGHALGGPSHHLSRNSNLHSRHHDVLSLHPHYANPNPTPSTTAQEYEYSHEYPSQHPGAHAFQHNQPQPPHQISASQSPAPEYYQYGPGHSAGSSGAVGYGTTPNRSPQWERREDDQRRPRDMVDIPPHPRNPRINPIEAEYRPHVPTAPQRPLPPHHNGAHDIRQYQQYLQQMSNKPPHHQTHRYIANPKDQVPQLYRSAIPMNEMKPDGNRPVDDNIDGSNIINEAAIRNGTETRTTIMIRNIPNKYTQLLLLEEVNTSGCHVGTYDFFYLPIDFKNHCNVGYGFISFADPCFIIPFLKEFEGKRFRKFNSLKICSCSFARIQGTDAMIARYKNSSLLSRDAIYRPLLFYTDSDVIQHGDRAEENGVIVGKQKPFPVGGRYH